MLQILDLEDQMESVVYCDYTEKNFYCKPEPEYFHSVSKVRRVQMMTDRMFQGTKESRHF